MTRSIEVKNANDREMGKAKVKGMDTSRHERYFLMALSAFGAIIGVTLTALGIAGDDPNFYFGTALGSAITSGSLLRMTILAPDSRGRRGKRGKRGRRGKKGS